jgi:N-acetylneuraminate synthase
VRIGSREIGPNHPVYIVAEAGVNHNGDPDLARRLVDAAAESQVDAVKFQVFRSSELVTCWAPKAEYQEAESKKRSHFEMLEDLELGIDTFANLKERCDRLGLEFLGTPFDLESAKELNSIGVRAFKIGSGDLTHLPLIKEVAGFGLPTILSTGMGTLPEIHSAVRIIADEGISTCLLHCTTQYPAKSHEINLRAMIKLGRIFGCPVGYSDHTVIPFTPILAVAAGASIIEKHFTLDRDLEGPDHSASLQPGELAEMVSNVRLTEQILGSYDKEPTASEEAMKKISRRSVVARFRILSGEEITLEKLAFKRPGTGIPPSELSNLIGKRIKRTVEMDELIHMKDIDEEG